MSDGIALPVEVTDLVRAAKQYVARATSIEPDLTLETLPLVDHYLEQARAGFEERPELESLVTTAIAAYFGEVVRLRLGGFWRVPSADAAEWRVCADRVFLSFRPLGMVYEALHRSDRHPGPSAEIGLAPEDRETVGARLAELPEVGEDEYFLLSTRAEVLDIAAEALRAQMIDGGLEDVVFDRGDYD